MQARQARFLDVIEKAPQFQIPLYQRIYSWTERECRQLWDDIVRAGDNEAIKVHFIGSVVYVEKEMSIVTHKSPVLVIDGQQRLTTITLLLAALAHTVGEDEPVDGFSADKIKSYYLINEKESDERYYKLILSQTDKDSLKAIIDGTALPTEYSIRISENYELFKKWLGDKKTDVATICRGVAKLMIVDIALTREQDNPQLIFESMNSTGKVLSQADLIRNYILMGLELELQTRLYNDHWRRMEVDFGQEAYSTHFDSFMRHYLTVKTGEIPNIGEVYEAFKLFARTTKPVEITDGQHIEALVKDIHRYGNHFCQFALGKETDAELKQVFNDIRELKVDVVYPFLLELYRDYEDKKLEKDDFVKIGRLAEAYVFRRAVCNIPTNSLNKTFSTFTKAIDKAHYLESAEAHLLLLPSYRRFPSDEEFNDTFQKRDLYNFRSRTYWLRKFENYGRKEPKYVNDYTIEHIMPQNENLSSEWRQALGAEWERIQKTWLHTLGNLTLTGYNSEYSDRPFVEKRDMDGGFKESPLLLNKDLGSIEVWDEEAIKMRAEQLATRAVSVWVFPTISKETLKKYEPEKSVKTTYSIEDHPYLAGESEMYGTLTHDLFEAIRKEILALDPVVTEDFLKLYVAYKAEVNFVDIIPRAQAMILSINMRGEEINDPRGLCKDVSQQGHWGNGAYEMKLESVDDIPYAMGLIRQALELQLGS